MTTTRRPLVAGNWKMNGLTDSIAELNAICEAMAEPAGALEGKIDTAGESDDASVPKVEIVVCPPSPLIPAFANRADMTTVHIGAQDCHTEESGAHTGDISAALLKDVGASHVIVGHSERRADHGETSALVKAKAEATLAQGLIAIVCIGETEAQRDTGDAEAVVVEQMTESLPDHANAGNLVVAYEPVWAIGTGRTPTVAQIADMHAALRDALVKTLGDAGKDVRILYGGSVKPGNAAEIFSIDDVDGGLIGGASLKATDFLGIVDAA